VFANALEPVPGGTEGLVQAFRSTSFTYIHVIAHTDTAKELPLGHCLSSGARQESVQACKYLHRKSAAASPPFLTW